MVLSELAKKKTEQEWLCTDGEAGVTHDKNIESELVKTKENNEIILMQPSNDCVEEKGLNRESAPFEIQSERYSSFTKLIRVTGFVCRFIKLIRNSVMKGGRNPNIVQTTYLFLSFTRQRNCGYYIHRENIFSELYHSFESKKQNNLQKQLGVYLDDNDQMRCKGRFENAD